APGPRASSGKAERRREEREPARSRSDRGARWGDEDERDRRDRRSREEEVDEDYDRGRPRLVRRDCEPHRGGLVLTMGIVSLVVISMMWCAPLGIIPGIVAWILGHIDLRKMKAGQMDPEGHGSTQAGYVCGIIGTAVNGLMLLACGGYLVFAFSFAAMS